jgi:Dyp-type peroxidase family
MTDPTTPPPAAPQPTFTLAELAQIQGFGIAGFNKDHQESLFVRIGSATGGQQLLTWLAPRIANAWEVGTFNSVFSEVRARTGSELLKATWTALLISAKGYEALGVDLSTLPSGESSNAFVEGMAARPSAIGDTQPLDTPTNWLPPFREGADQVHLAIIVASDDQCDLDRELVAIYQKVAETRCEVVFDESGATLPPPLTGHEHFGFKDGISQPSITGYSPPPAAGEPPAVAAGEFVLGYPDGSGVTAGAGTNWANGSFVVFRRLLQNVAAFRTFTEAGVAGSSPTVAGGQLAADMIGRWPSGAPVELFPAADPGPENDVNNFAYLANDPDGHICPVWAHIRKTNPRDEATPGGQADDPTMHRMIRRGIPFGPPLPASATADDGVPRGLHFYSVVSDVVRQFEFIQSNWMNNPNFPIGSQPAQPGGPYMPPTPGQLAGGPDPVVGEHDSSAQCVLVQASGSHPFPVPTEFVNVSAGEYFFMPSLPALQAISSS